MVRHLCHVSGRRSAAFSRGSPAECSLHIRHNLIYSLPLEVGEQACQQEQVINPKECSPVSESYKGITTGKTGPCCRQGLDTALALTTEEDALLAPRVGVPLQLELLAAQRMKGMGDPKCSRIVPLRCT